MWDVVPERASLRIAQLELLADAMGTEHFEQRMLDVVNTIAPVEEIWGLAIASDLRPKPIAWCGKRADMANRARKYAQNYSRFDPLMLEITEQKAPNLMMVRLDRSMSIDHDMFRWSCFEEPEFASRITVGRTHPFGWSMVSFFCGADQGMADLTARLSEFAVSTYPLARRHFDLPDWSHSGQLPVPTDRIETKLSKRFPALTPRECTVCAMTMVGYSSGRIALDLGIAQATVLTYRRRAYERLGISSAAELVAQFI